MRAGDRSFSPSTLSCRPGAARNGARRWTRPFAGRGCRHHGRRGLLGYASDRYPDLRLHLSVQGSATHADAIELMKEQFGIKRVVLRARADAGRDRPHLRTGQRRGRGVRLRQPVRDGRGPLPAVVLRHRRFPNNKGVCSPAHAVRWVEDKGRMDARLNGILIDRYEPGEPAAYPTLCKGRFKVDGADDHALEEPTSLNAIGLLPRLARWACPPSRSKGGSAAGLCDAGGVHAARRAGQRARRRRALLSTPRMERHAGAPCRGLPSHPRRIQRPWK